MGRWRFLMRWEDFHQDGRDTADPQCFLLAQDLHARTPRRRSSPAFREIGAGRRRFAQDALTRTRTCLSGDDVDATVRRNNQRDTRLRATFDVT